MTKKKDTKAKNKSRQKRQQKKQMKNRSKSKLKSQLTVANKQFVERPPFSEIEAPDGFLPIATTHAFMEYGKPLNELSEHNDIDALNNVLEIVMSLWNYTVDLEDGKDSKEKKKKILDSFKSIFSLDSNEATELLNKMVERKKYLFPAEIQPDHPMTKFMRKELSSLIANFNNKSLVLSDDPIAADIKDKLLVRAIITMDEFMIGGADYDDWEDHYFSMEQECSDRFKKWLIEKGATEYSEDFPFWVQTYLNFIYNYLHDDIVLLKEVQPVYIEEFFADFILRKIMVKPHEYVEFVPAIKTFYIFLFEKGYIDNPEPMIALFDACEPVFIDILRTRFG